MSQLLVSHHVSWLVDGTALIFIGGKGHILQGNMSQSFNLLIMVKAQGWDGMVCPNCWYHTKLAS